MVYDRVVLGLVLDNLGLTITRPRTEFRHFRNNHYTFIISKKCFMCTTFTSIYITASTVLVHYVMSPVRNKFISILLKRPYKKKYQGNISSGFSSNSEAYVLELLENPEDMLRCHFIYY